MVIEVIVIFKDRRDAAQRLASKLMQYENSPDALILALPRGGVVTGYEIAKILNCPLDIIIIRKIGFPSRPEFAIGAVSETGKVVLNEDVVRGYGISETYIKAEVKKEEEEISRRKSLYRGGKGIPSLAGKVIILVDDGIATGATMKAAIETLKKEGLAKLVVAVPVAPPETAEAIRKITDEFVCLEMPDYFMAVGNYYHDFTQVSNEEVVELLKSSSWK